MNRRTRFIAAGAAALMVLGGGAAFAYWTSTGSGTGSVVTADGGSSVTINQTTSTIGLMPGGNPVLLQGNFTNLNAGPVTIPGIYASVTSVDKAGCLLADYVIAGTSYASPASIPVGTNVGTWAGETIQLRNTTANQDACKGAVVTLSYSTVAPAASPAVSLVGGMLTVDYIQANAIGTNFAMSLYLSDPSVAGSRTGYLPAHALNTSTAVFAFSGSVFPAPAAGTLPAFTGNIGPIVVGHVYNVVVYYNYGAVAATIPVTAL